MAVLLGNINGRLEHQDTERYPWNPGDEAEDVEDGKNQEHDGRRVVVSCKVHNCRPETKDDLENGRDPDELLGKRPSQGKVGIAANQCDCQNEGEENNGICREPKVVGRAVNATLIRGAFCGRVSLDADAADCCESQEDDDQLLTFSQSASDSV